MKAEEVEFGEWAIVAERWRPIVGYPGLYEVSDHGHVRRVGRRVLADRAAPGGYRAVNLWRGGHARGHLVHVLVAAAFLGPVPAGHEVNHRDGYKGNNHATNLEYLTRSDNLRHAYAIGLRRPTPPVGRNQPAGEASPHAKLTAAQVVEIRQLYRPHAYSTRRLAREFGVSQSVIVAIVNGRAWKGIAA